MIYHEKPLTIVLANAISIWGGSENRLVVMARSLAEAGHRVIFYHRNDEISRRLAGSMVEEVRLPFVNDVDPYTWLRLVAGMRRARPHMLIFSDDRAMRLAGSAAALCRVKFRVHIKGHQHFKLTPRTRHVYRALTTHVMCVTESVRRLIADAGILDMSRVAVIYFPFDPKRFIECHSRAFREELGTPAGATLFGNVARLSEMKGQKYFLEAARLVVQQAPDTRFVIVGRGRLERRLREQIRESGLSEHVHLAGHREDIPQVMNSLDVMVLSSVYGEALGGAVLEAMAAAKPVIVTRVGGLPELVEEGQSGLIVPPGNSQALAQAMLDLHRRQDARAEMGRRGREILLHRFTPQRFWEVWNPLFQEAAQR